MYYLSMDLTGQALQINVKFFQISESFFELVEFFKIIVVLGLRNPGGEAFVLNRTHSS